MTMTPRTLGWSPARRLQAWIGCVVRRRLWRIDEGAGTLIEPGALIDRTWPRGLHIGRDCYIGDQAVILTHDFTRGLLLDTRIGDRCRVGARAIVFPGITIGNDCVIWPGALVNRDMPDGHEAIGNPARITPAGEAR